MAAEDTAYGEVEAAGGAMLLQCLDGILRTGGGEAARGGCERRYTGTVEVYREQQNEGEQALQVFHIGWESAFSVSPILPNRRTMRFSM